MSELRCYMRYGNAGQLYRVCNSDKKFSPEGKKTAKLTPLITQDAFIEQIGKPYSSMSSSQQSAYHALASKRAMREKRIEEKKQKEMNAEEYKQYLLSIREDKVNSKKQDRLFKQNIKNEKELQRLVKQSGFNIGNKEDIKSHLDKRVESELKKWSSNEYEEKWKRQETARWIEDNGSLKEEDLKQEVIDKGRGELRRKKNMVNVNGRMIYLDKFLNDTGLNKASIYQLGGNPDAVNDNMKKIVLLTNMLLKKKSKSDKETTKTYSGFIGAFKRYTREDTRIADLLNEEGEKKALEKQIKKLQEPRKEKFDKFEDNLSKEYKVAKERKEKDLTNELQYQKDNAINALQDLQNRASNEGFDEGWIKKNIRIGINEDGYVNTDSESMAKKLIRAKDIIQNIGDIEKLKDKK